MPAVQGRHPVVEWAVPSFQPNDTFISEQCCLHIISGPTAAGKSTYLRQASVE